MQQYSTHTRCDAAVQYTHILPNNLHCLVQKCFSVCFNFLLTNFGNSNVHSYNMLHCIWSWKKMQVSVIKYIIHTVYLLHVSATHMAIFTEMRYKEYLHRNITFYGTRRFITTFTGACHQSISWARSIQSMYPISFLEDPFSYYPPNYAWIIQVVSWHQVSQQNPVCTSPVSYTCHMPHPSRDEKSSI